MAADDMIVVSGACKQYTSEWNVTKMFSPRDKPHLALAGLDMTVPKGSIYALLGPSGCGKTTLLSCIIGRRCMNAGEIRLGVTSSKKIGYMPQEVALQIDLSIEENISFYGHLFNLTSEQMEAKRNNLYQFLEIPHHHRLVSQISGGQQRRVSLFIALLHDPELLILDEPTVGLDPCLSHKIWEYFIYLSTKEGRTVLITTHYIEEARKADKVGLMRIGVILEEGNPGELMSRYGVESMDELFLKITMQQPSPDEEDEQTQPKAIADLSGAVMSPLKSSSALSLHRLKSAIINDYYWSKRNFQFVLLLLILPVLDSIIFQMAIGRNPDEMKIGLVNDEQKMGREFCRNWAGSCDMDNFSDSLSCGLLEELERHKMKFVAYPNTAEAAKGLSENQIWGYIHVPANYSWALLNRLEMNWNAKDDAVDMSLIEVQLDMTNLLFVNLLRTDMYRSYLKFLEKLHEGCGWKVQAARLPIHFKDPVHGREDITFTEFNIPSIIIMSIYFFPAAYALGSVISEKKLGLWERYFLSGLNVGEIILGHSFITFALLVFQVFSVMVLEFAILDNVIIGSAALYSCLLFIIGVAGITFGVLVAMISEEEFFATSLGLGAFFFYTMVCGLIWPVQGMHMILQKLSWILPLTIPGESLRSISVRGWGLSEPTVYNGFLITIAWFFIHIIVTYAVVQLRKKS